MDLPNDIRKNDHEIHGRTCFVCKKMFSGNSQLYRHLREVHKTLEKAPSKNPRSAFKCLEGCGIAFRIREDLRVHLNESHGFSIGVKTIEFKKFEDFQKWFVALQETGICFIKNQGSHSRRKYSRISYYSCNRSGQQRYKAMEARQRARPDSRKINAGCTSFVKLVEMSGKCLVTYCSFHYGHKMELEHSPLSFSSRAKIVDMLEKGAQIVKIKLDEGGSYIGLNNIQRWKILTSADLKSLKYYTKKELKTMPTLRRKNIDVIEPDEEICTGENESGDVITIISGNNDFEDASEEQIMYRDDNEIGQSSTEDDVVAMENLDTEEVLAEEYFGEETVDSHDDSIEIKDESIDEDMYGHYVAETLKTFEPCKQVLVKEQIDKLLETFLRERPT